MNVFVCCHNVKTNQKRIAVESALNLTSSEVASDEVDFRAVSEVDFRAVSLAMVFWFPGGLDSVIFGTFCFMQR